MSTRLLTALATFLALVPVTLLVPGLHELVVVAHGGTEGDAHAFMTVNMIAGMIAVPFAMRAVRTGGRLRQWIIGALLIDAAAFTGMWLAPSLPVLYAFRVLDGATHLPAVTMLMVASNRLAGERRGGALGALATAIMIGVAVGSPLGGWLVERAPGAVYVTGASLLVVAAIAATRLRRLPLHEGGTPGVSRYRWDRRSLATWIPLGYGFIDRFSIGIFVSTFTLYLTSVVGLSAPQRGMLIALFMLPFALLCYPAGRLADRIGWFAPMLTGNILFGVVFAMYGVLPASWLPLAMVASGVFSALMFTPNLLLISDLVRRGHGEGLFGAFQVAGSLGFLTGPIVGGLLVSVTRDASGVPAYRQILTGVGALAVVLAMTSFVVLRRLAAEVREQRRERPAPAPLAEPVRS
ncbi:MAG TPA: MFS transporter [bacterium]|nr:MFS transporter [bacterium]